MTERPSWADRIATAYPPGPPPRTTTSACFMSFSLRCCSAFDDVHGDGEAAGRGLLVLGAHVDPRCPHRVDDLIKAHPVGAVAAQRHAGGIDGLARRDGITFDARDLHEPADRVTGQPKAVFHRDLGRVLHLLRCTAE